MKFDIILPKTLNKLQNFEFEMYEEYSQIETFSIVENALDEIEGCEFYFNSLGEIWNVTIFGDFSVFLEQLTNILLVINNKRDSYILDFYEVGTDRKLLITNVDEDSIRIENISGSNWINSNIEIIKKKRLYDEILSFVGKIKNTIEIVAPEVNKIQILNKWYTDIGVD